METVKKSISEVLRIFTEISQLLQEYSYQYNTAAYDILTDGLAVQKVAADMLDRNHFDKLELNRLISVESSFGRHLSEVEQSVYEEIGAENYERIQALLIEEAKPYNFIYYYLDLGKGN